MHDNVIDSAHINRVVRGGITAFALYMAGAGLACCSQLAIARIVGAETYGIYGYAQATLAVLIIFVNLGLDKLLTREVAQRPEDRVA